MSIEGSLETMPLEDLLDWLHRRSAQGKLLLQKDSVRKTLTLRQGKICNAASTDPREFLGQYLINFGLLSEDQLQKAFETQLETGVMLGRVLVLSGAITQEQIQRVLELKMKETVLDAFLWEGGRFGFQPQPPSSPASDVTALIGLSELYREGLERRGRFAEIRRLIPVNDMRFQLKKRPAGLDPHSVSGVILELAAQGNSAADIILKFHSLDYPILNQLFDFCRKGYLSPLAAEEPQLLSESDLEPLPASEPPRKSPPPPLPQSAGVDDFLSLAERLINERDYQGALQVLLQGLQIHPYDPDLSQAREIAEKGLTEQLKTGLLAYNRVPHLARPDALAKGLELNPAQRYLLSRIDGKRTIRSIVMVSPLKEIDALLNFRQLIDQGLVVLK